MDMYVAEILFGGFALLLLLGAPITVALGGAAMGAYVVLDKDPIALVQIAFNSVGSFPLMALPAFVLAVLAPRGIAASARSRVRARPPPPPWAC